MRARARGRRGLRVATRRRRARLPPARPHLPLFSCTLGRYDIKWVEVCADDVAKFADMGVGTKPLFIFFKTGLEKARMDGANGNELQRLVEQHCGAKKAA